MDRQKALNSHPLSDFEGRDTPSAEEEIQELARLIYAEAGRGDEQTKAIVGWSARNRVSKRGYPDTYTGVIHEKKNGKKQYVAVSGKRWNDAADPGQTYRGVAEYLKKEAAAGRLSIKDPLRASEYFLSMILVKDHIAMPLGCAPAPSKARIRERVRDAVEVFMAAYGKSQK